MRAQDLVPGAYTPAPVGINVLTVSTVFSEGDIAFDPSLPVEEATRGSGMAAVGIGRTLNMGGRFANIGVGVPFVVGHVEGLVLEQFQEASRAGLGDLAGRVAINLYGAPAMTLKEFAAYRPTTIVGVSLSVGAPVGQYDSDSLHQSRHEPMVVQTGGRDLAHTRSVDVRRGHRRGVLHRQHELRERSTREQAPIVALQGHLIHTFRPGFWVAADGNYWKGGRITTNGTRGAGAGELPARGHACVPSPAASAAGLVQLRRVHDGRRRLPLSRDVLFLRLGCAAVETVS